MQKTLDSVLKQKIRPKFHVFIDLKSTDHTTKIIAEYKKNNKDINVIFLLQNSKGIYQAWNQGLIYLLEKVENNHFVCILNSDDWLQNNYITNISRHKQHDLIAGSCIVHYKNKKFVRPCRNLKYLPIFMAIMDPSLIVRASVFREIGIYREKFLVAADHDFIYRAYEMGCKIKILDEVLVNVKMGGFASQNKEIAFLEQLELSKERSFLPIPELAFLYRSLKLPRLRLFDFL